MSAEIQFWLYFFLINSFFFLPRYLLELQTSTFIPYKGLTEGPLKERVRFLINRYNYDIFRVSFDFFLLTVLFLFLRDYLTTQQYLWIVFPIFILLWVYQLYYHIFESIYQLEPTFHSDSLMLKTGFNLFFKSFGWVNFSITVGIILFFSLVFFLLSKLLTLVAIANCGALTIALSLLFGLMGIYSLLTYKYKSYGKIVFPSQIQSLYRNIRQSLITKRNLDAYDFKALAAHRPYADLQLSTKPNIHFLVVESYGRILYDHPELFADYQQRMQSFEALLAEKQWHTASHLSTSPISGGSSWISFTTLLFGLCIKDQGSYLTMLHHPDMQEYPNIMRVMRELAYKTYRLVAIPKFRGMKIPWDAYQSFYAIDEWINFEDLNYQGKMYGFGPCPPDQYSLNFAHQYIKEQEESPYFLFFITQNSHSPFGSPTQVVDDWQTLNEPFGEAQFSSSIFVQPKLEDYQKAISYQLENLTDFIHKKGAENDIFIIAGDHQPPIFPKPGDGWETPIHIISKNKAFIDALKHYEFSEGLLADKNKTPFRHEGVYSMFMREFFQYYGADTSTLPDYKPEGVKFD